MQYSKTVSVALIMHDHLTMTSGTMDFPKLIIKMAYDHVFVCFYVNSRWKAWVFNQLINAWAFVDNNQ